MRKQTGNFYKERQSMKEELARILTKSKITQQNLDINKLKLELIFHYACSAKAVDDCLIYFKSEYGYTLDDTEGLLIWPGD